MINMRGHHLLCVLTFEGAGYSQRFTRNLAAIVERLSAGEEILIVAGPDDICAPVVRMPIPIVASPASRGATRLRSRRHRP